MLVVALFIIVICISIPMVANPKLWLYAIPILVSFELRYRFLGVSFDLIEICTVIVIIAWAWQFCFSAQANILAVSQIEQAGVLLLALLAFPSVFLEDNLQHALSSYRDFLIPIVFFICFSRLRIDSVLLQRVVKLAFVLALGNALLGIWQYKSGHYMWSASEAELDWQAFKIGLVHITGLDSLAGLGETLAVGAYSGANNFGTYLTIPFCISGVLACSKELGRKGRIVYAGITILFFVALLCTFFRSALLIAIISIVVLWLSLSKRAGKLQVITATAAGGLLLYIFLIPGFLDWDNYGTLSGRWGMFGDALDLLGKHPLQLMIGGMTDFYRRTYAQPQDVHNMVLYCILQFGLPVTLLFLGLLTLWIVRCWRAAKNANGLSKKMLLAILVPVAANIFLYGQTTMLFDSVQISLMLFFWLGIANHLTEGSLLRGQFFALDSGYLHCGSTLPCERSQLEPPRNETGRTGRLF